jgi:3-dehydroquinate synthase
LPPRELSQGFAEIIKHAIIADAEMFNELGNVDPVKIDLAALIKRNVEIKAQVVEQDEREQTGGRALLNFGHTIGHGIERAVNYHGILHGEAVSLGMVAAAEVSTRKAGLAQEQRQRVVDLLRKFGLPTQLLKDFPREKIFEALKFDKKFVRGEIRFVVSPKIGSAYLSSSVTADDIRSALAAL